MQPETPAPERRWRVLVFIASAVCLMPGIFWSLPTGKAIEGALRIIDGQAPYRDFWSMYAPGQFYAIAALFKLFGREILVQAIAVVLVRAASTVVFFSLLRRMGSSRGLSLVLAGVFAGMFWTTGPELTSYPLALLFLLLALDRITRYLNGGGTRHLCWAGCLAGVAAFFKHDVAAYIVIGAAVGLVVAWMRAGERRPADWIEPRKAALALGGCALIVVIPCMAWVAWVAAPDAWQDLIVFPATAFSKVRNDDYPGLVPPFDQMVSFLRDLSNLRVGRSAGYAVSDWILCNLPQYVFIGAAGIVAIRPRELGARPLALVVLCLGCMPFFWLAAHVQFNTHVYSMAILSLLLWAMAWQWLASKPRWRFWGRAIIGACITVHAIGCLIPSAMKVYRMASEWSAGESLDLPGVRGIRVSAREYTYYQPIARFFREHTAPDERTYSGLLRHDAVVINKPIFHALTGRASCCRYSELHPAVADRESVQREIIEDLERHNVRGIIIWRFGWSDAVLDEFKARSIAAVSDGGSTLLDEYVAERFEAVSQYDEFTVMWRKDLPRPVEAPGP